jgi:iron-sulfur cluster repair protein YtfE (RIC family)
MSPNSGPAFFAVASYGRRQNDRTQEAFARVVALACAQSWPRALRVFRVLARRMERHVRLAEDVLFPLFELKAGGETELTRTLVTDHRAIEQGLECLEACLRERRLDDLPGCVRTLRRVVDEHGGREERLLYPMIDRLLSEEERQFLSTRALRPRRVPRSPAPAA